MGATPACIEDCSKINTGNPVMNLWSKQFSERNAVFKLHFVLIFFTHISLSAHGS
jgi:hypothetical protein